MSSCSPVLLLFGIILLHEFGHCFGARYVDGDAKEILIWPLGGLAYVDVPHTPRAQLHHHRRRPGRERRSSASSAPSGWRPAGFLPER